MKEIALSGLIALATVVASSAAAATFTYVPLKWQYPSGSPEPSGDHSIHVSISRYAALESVEFYRADEWFFADADGHIDDYGWNFSCVVTSGAKHCQDDYPHKAAPLMNVLTGSRGIRITVRQADLGPMPPGGTYISGPHYYFGILRIVATGPENEDPLIGEPQFRAIDDYLPVPEPTTWSLMISGFGLAGGLLRRRKLAAAWAARAPSTRARHRT